MSKFHQVRDNPLALLTPDEVIYPAWLFEMANKRVFYVRGFSWFWEHTKANLTFFQKVHSKPEQSVLDYPQLGDMSGWRAVDLPWDEKLGWKKAWGATQKNGDDSCLSFTKAAMTILLCELYVREIAKSPESAAKSVEDLYEHMSVQPAHSYVHGFDRSIIDRIRRADDRALEKLKIGTQQKSFDVFYDMADGNTVTHQLACRVRRFIADHFRHFDIGDVDYRQTKKIKFRPAMKEFIDLDYGNASLIDWLAQPNAAS